MRNILLYCYNNDNMRRYVVLYVSVRVCVWSVRNTHTHKNSIIRPLNDAVKNRILYLMKAFLALTVSFSVHILSRSCLSDAICNIAAANVAIAASSFRRVQLTTRFSLSFERLHIVTVFAHYHLPHEIWILRCLCNKD